MTKSDYESLLKRIEKNISNVKLDKRFELPTVEVTWEGKKTILRNFSDFPKALRRDMNIILQYLSKEFAVPAERVGDKAIFAGRRDPDDFTRLFKFVKHVEQNLQLKANMHNAILRKNCYS